MYMDVLLLLLSIIIWVKYILIGAMRPLPSPMSRFELERRAKLSKKAKEELSREDKLSAILFIQRAASSLMLVAGVLLSVAYLGWLSGVLVSIVVAVVASLLSTQQLVVRVADGVYARLEPALIRFITKADLVFRHISPPSSYDSGRYRRLDSKEDLIHLVEMSKGTLTDSQQRIISSTLVFEEKKVKEIMTPRSAINSIKKEEFLGPLVLDELHALGSSRLPVIDGDIDHVVGILYLRDLLSLDEKRSVAAEEAMDKKVYYINQDDTLEHALSAFLKVRHHLFIVINDERETVGLLSLEDVIETLIGQKIVDEDDHTSPAAVSRKNDNNRPAGRVDL